VAWSRAAARLARSSSRGDQRRASSLGQRRPDPAAPVLSGGGVVEDLAPAASSSSVRRCQLCSACRSSHFRRLDVSAGSGTRRCSSVVLFLSARWHPRSLSLSPLGDGPPCPAASLLPDDELSACARRPPYRFLLHYLREPSGAAPPLW
jgi:hypothetical protein